MNMEKKGNVNQQTILRYLGQHKDWMLKETKRQTSINARSTIQANYVINERMRKINARVYIYIMQELCIMQKYI